MTDYCRYCGHETHNLHDCQAGRDHAFWTALAVFIPVAVLVLAVVWR